MAVQTKSGPVDLRKARSPQAIVLNGMEAAGPINITKKWLVHIGASSGGDRYYSAVKQAMMLAATKMELKDLYGPHAKDPDTGQKRTRAKLKEAQTQLQKKLEGLEKGTAPVPRKNMPPRKSQSKAAEGKAVRHVAMKRSRRTGRLAKRYFALDGGKLKLYPSEKITAKVGKIYELTNVKCKFESTKSPGLSEPFPPGGYEERVSISTKLRPHGPVYLYSKQTGQARLWERAIKLSRFLNSPSDREALASVVSRVAGAVVKKGWDALFRYSAEIEQTKAFVKQVALRLSRVEYVKGWQKMRMVYKQRSVQQSLKDDQERWSTQFLQEKLDRMKQPANRTLQMVQRAIIAAVQAKFRNYRQEKIQERAYPLGRGVTTRLQQAQTGKALSASFTSLKSTDALSLILNNECLDAMRTDPEVFKTKVKTYSEVNSDVRYMNITVSDNLAMLAFADTDLDQDNQELSKAAWAQFVNIDKISSVVLHSDRKMGHRGKRYVLQASMCRGVWLTINGPRVCWCRQIRTQHDPQHRTERREVVGASNGISVATALARGEKVKWLRIAVALRGASIPRELEKNGKSGKDAKESQEVVEDNRLTYMVMHFLGRRFQSERVKGESPLYFADQALGGGGGGGVLLEAEVPISYDEQALAVLDESEVTIDIVEWSEDPKRHQTIWAGKMLLWKIFAPPESLSQQQERAAHRTLHNISGVDKEREEVISLAQTLSNGDERVARIIRLVPPYELEGVQQKAAAVELEFTATVLETTAELGQRCISPELHGRGPTTALFSTHRGAWYDPKIGPGKFLSDRVANFVELIIWDLDFPSDLTCYDRRMVYSVEAKCYGVAATTVALNRPKEAWSKVLPDIDPMRIRYRGAKLSVPLPPGAWCSDQPRQRPYLELRVLQQSPVKESTIGFVDLKRNSRRDAPPAPSAHVAVAYHARLSLDDLLLDQTKEGRRVTLSSAMEAPAKATLASGGHVADNNASIVLDIVLRDRDYVRVHAEESPPQAARPVLGQEAVLCVGDRALLRVEEPILYPQTELEYRRRLLPGEWNRRDVDAKQGAWAAPLRDPLLQYECAKSGLEKISGVPEFKPKYIPSSLDNVIPCKYLMPPSEVDFILEARPGVFWRVADQLVDEVEDEDHGGRALAPGEQVVTRLSHLLKHIPCTVLAVYASGRCDLELSPAFLHEWERHPERQYAIPGIVVMKEFVDASGKASLQPPATEGTGDLVRKRVILKEVPLGMVTSVQTSGFNVYDAAFSTVEDAIKQHPNQLGNDFDPCRIGDGGGAAQVHSGGYRLAAGPVPSDAGPTCQYEWSLHLQMRDEEDMFQFVTNLRHTSRQQLHELRVALQAFNKKSRDAAKQATYAVGPAVSQASGHLEVVLVEARTLRPAHVLPQRGLMEKVTKGFSSQMNPHVVFRLRHGGTHDLVYRGSKVQNAPQISSDRPNWSEIAELQSSGGWVFKSPTLEPEGKGKIPDLKIQMEILNKAGISDKPIGVVEVPVFGSPDQSLCNAQAPFHNIWMPLSKRDEEVHKKTFEGMPQKFGLEVAYDTGLVKGVKGEEQGAKLGVQVGWLIDEVDGHNYLKAIEALPDKKKLLTDKAAGAEPYTITFRSSSLSPNPHGEIHFMTLWVPENPTKDRRWLPKTARGWLMQTLRPKVQGEEIILRDPLYMVQVQKRGYNPNKSREGFPEPMYEALESHLAAMNDTVPFLECHDSLKSVQWDKFWAKMERSETRGHAGGGDTGRDSELSADEAPPPSDANVGLFRAKLASKNPAKLHEIDAVLRRGVPPARRRKVWMEVTGAENVEELVLDSDRSIEAYQKLLETGRASRGEAMLQLQEDVVAASTWETSRDGRLQELHLERLRRAQDVCIALITFSRDGRASGNVRNFVEDSSGKGDEPPCGVAYCQALLVLAFYLLLGLNSEELQDSGSRNRFEGKLAARIYDRELSEDRTDMDKRSDLEKEVKAFWLLYTLTGSPSNQAYRDYYGVPRPRRDKQVPDEGPIADIEGAMSDVYFLYICLARFERELFVHLNALGFHLSTVFYGAFMQLYAFLLPPASLFRFWDLLFAESVNPTLKGKPPRHSLVDLAFAAMRACRKQLMHCESTTEARDVIVGLFEAMYDPVGVVELATEGERALWHDDAAFEAAGVLPQHAKQHIAAKEMWMTHYLTVRAQNRVLRELTQETDVSLDGTRAITSSAAGATRPSGDTRITTKNVVNIIIPTLQEILNSEGGDTRYGGMFRPVPARLRELGPDADSGLADKVTGFITWAQQSFGKAEDLSKAVAYSVASPPECPGEPTRLDANEFERAVDRGLGAGWAEYVEPLYEAFRSPTENRMSLNEFFIALICCSKGTVGEKAVALFTLYASVQPPHRIPHVVPVGHAATTVVEKIEGSQQRAEGLLFRAPRADEVSQSFVLHFRIYTHGKSAEVNIGEVFIPSLRPYISSGLGTGEPQQFPIWGPERQLHATHILNSAAGPDGGKRHTIGEMRMGIQWMPASETQQDVGQLCIHLHHIYFDRLRVEVPRLQNPRVTVVTYNESGQEEPVPKWQPETPHNEGSGLLAMVSGSTSGEIIEFPETMSRNAFGSLSHKWGSGDHGWDSREEVWKWGSSYGLQYSIKGMRVRKEYVVKGPTGRPNTISLRACRLITQGILTRCLHPITNRQAALIADQTFNRAQAVAGILDAVLVQGAGLTGKYKSIQHMKESSSKTSYVDVKHQILLAHEEMVSTNEGHINLFGPPGQAEVNGSLDALKIKDPFPGKPKTLWVRFVRAGDGQRFNALVEVQGNGAFVTKSVPLDMEMSNMAGKVQMNISKEEFVTCILASPLLSESLRRLSTSDNNANNIPMGQPIRLDVSITDPAREREEEDFYDAMSVRQGILFEIWGSVLGRDDFLGECWLPPFSDLGPTERQFVLPINSAPPDKEGHQTRPDSRKHAAGASRASGNLFITASWVFPLQEGDADGSLHDRGQMEEGMHTGRLRLKILKAENLRSPHAKGEPKDQNMLVDAYVQVYMRNEAIGRDEEVPGLGRGGWHTGDSGSSRPVAFMTTSTKRQTLSPEWHEEAELQVQTGGFQARMRKAQAQIARSQNHRHATPDDHDLAVVGGEDEIKIHFGDTGSQGQPGHRHGIKVYLGETIHQFRWKLAEACRIEAERSSGDGETEKAAQYQAAAREMSSRHVVMVFVPSQRLRDLAQAQQTGGKSKSSEYNRQYKAEDQDPSSWQPLDPIRTFGHYTGFGLERPQRLRVTEGTDEYKLRNNRFRQFEHQRQKWRERIESLNTDKECFGFAQYVHKMDGGSKEWRPAKVERVDPKGGTTRRFKVEFMFTPLSTWSGASGDAGRIGDMDRGGKPGDASERTVKEELDEESVLMAPANPRILGSAHREHQALLAQVNQLHNDGMTEKEIAVYLNEELKERWAIAKESSSGPPPPDITLSDVQHALRQIESGIGMDSRIRSASKR